MIKHYRSSIIFTVLALAIGFYLGGIQALIIVAILGILETSLSFDNAVVNASVLKNWDEKWRNRFITWGIPVAVFGMRLLFPLAIVSIVSNLNVIEALNLALSNPKQYETIITSAHIEISAFGGIFLWMVFIDYFCQEEKEHDWIPYVELALSKFGRLGLATASGLALILLISSFVEEAHTLSFIKSGLYGLIVYLVVQGLGTLAESDEAASNIVKQGIGGFMYLELLDASFSFDGVVAAFALTNNIFVMMIGLSIGAMFVRSMTLHLVDKGTLNEYKYLEHGAFWAIGLLASIMLIGATGLHISEVITGLSGAVLIGLSIWSSIKSQK
jgi:hypothetical protein